MRNGLHRWSLLGLDGRGIRMSWWKRSKSQRVSLYGVDEDVMWTDPHEYQRQSNENNRQAMHQWQLLPVDNQGSSHVSDVRAPRLRNVLHWKNWTFPSWWQVPCEIPRFTVISSVKCVDFETWTLRTGVPPSLWPFWVDSGCPYFIAFRPSILQVGHRRTALTSTKTGTHVKALRCTNFV